MEIKHNCKECESEAKYYEGWAKECESRAKKYADKCQCGEKKE